MTMQTSCHVLDLPQCRIVSSRSQGSYEKQQTGSRRFRTLKLFVNEQSGAVRLFVLRQLCGISDKYVPLR